MCSLTRIQTERHLKALPRSTELHSLHPPCSDIRWTRICKVIYFNSFSSHRDSAFQMQLRTPKYADINSHALDLLPAVDKLSTSWNAAIFHSGMELACVCTSRVPSPQTLLYVRSAAAAMHFLHSARLQKLHSCCSKCYQHPSLSLSASLSEPSSWLFCWSQTPHITSYMIQHHSILDWREGICQPPPSLTHVLSMNHVWEHPALFPCSPSLLASPTRTHPTARACGHKHGMP